MKKKTKKEKIAALILRNTAYWNGWYIDEDGRKETCEKLAANIIRYYL